MRKRVIILSFILISNTFFLFANTKYYYGFDINLNDVGISIIQKQEKTAIKASVIYPINSLINGLNYSNNYEVQDFFETYFFHTNITYNLISYNSLFLNLGLASDIFVQFDIDRLPYHYTCFTIGPYGEIGYKFIKNNEEKIYLSLSLNLPLISKENIHTNYMDPIQEGWNELIDFNSAIFYMALMAYKINITIPFN